LQRELLGLLGLGMRWEPELPPQNNANACRSGTTHKG